MKRILCMVVVLILMVSLCACGGSKDKEKLVGGMWKREDRHDYSTYNADVYWDSYYCYAFYDDDTFLYCVGDEYKVREYSPYFDCTPLDLQVESGTYKVKDGIITLTFSDGDTEDIPYYISEYTKELIFDVDTSGNSDWHHSDTTVQSWFSDWNYKGWDNIDTNQ